MYLFGRHMCPTTMSLLSSYKMKRDRCGEDSSPPPFKELSPSAVAACGLQAGSGGSAMSKSKKAKTHFEQVPLETVKNIIADEEIPGYKGDSNDAIVETPAKGEP